MQNYEFSYDKEHDDLLIHRAGAKSAGSIDAGDLLVDLDKNRKPVGIQIINASAFISSVLGQENGNAARVMLCNLREVSLEIKTHKKMLFIRISLANSSSSLSPLIILPKISVWPGKAISCS